MFASFHGSRRLFDQFPRPIPEPTWPVLLIIQKCQKEDFNGNLVHVFTPNAHDLVPRHRETVMCDRDHELPTHSAYSKPCTRPTAISYSSAIWSLSTCVCASSSCSLSTSVKVYADCSALSARWSHLLTLSYVARNLANGLSDYGSSSTIGGDMYVVNIHLILLEGW